jgi:hypothetical protein
VRLVMRAAIAEQSEGGGRGNQAVAKVVSVK